MSRLSRVIPLNTNLSSTSWQRLTCCICNDLVVRPIQCDTGAHIMCGKCGDPFRKCPMDGTGLQESEQITQCLRLLRICCAQPKCNWVGTIEQGVNHECKHLLRERRYSERISQYQWFCSQIAPFKQYTIDFQEHLKQKPQGFQAYIAPHLFLYARRVSQEKQSYQLWINNIDMLRKDMVCRYRLVAHHRDSGQELSTELFSDKVSTPWFVQKAHLTESLTLYVQTCPKNIKPATEKLKPFVDKQHHADKVGSFHIPEILPAIDMFVP